MDFKLIRKYPKSKQLYDMILSEKWFRNYRKNPRAPHSEWEKIKLDGTSEDYPVIGVPLVLSIMREPFVHPNSVNNKTHGMEYHQVQIIIDSFSLPKILEFIDYRIHHIISNQDSFDIDAVNESQREAEQERLENEYDRYDPYSGEVPPDPVDIANDVFLGMGDEDDGSGYLDMINEDKEIEKQIELYQEAEASGKIPYKKILSSEWVADYRKNPPASSFQELGDFSSYDEFENNINSLIVDLVNKKNFLSESNQKLFDYLPLRDVFNLIQNNAY